MLWCKKKRKVEQNKSPEQPMAPTTIKKDIEPSVKTVLGLMAPSTYKVKMPGHHLHDRVFELTKGERLYNFNSSAAIVKGIQTHKEIQFENSDTVEFTKGSFSIYTPGKYVILNHITYNEEFTAKEFAGNITSFSTCKELSELDNKFLRFIIPLDAAKPFDIQNFQRQFIETPNRKTFPCIPLTISGEEYHFIVYKLGDEYHLIIDSIQHTELKQFQKKCFNALLALGFIKGNLIHDECFILSFSDAEMSAPQHIVYHSMGASVSTNQPTFTANPFSVHSDVDFPKDEKGAITEEAQKKLYEGIIYFPREVFSKLATLFYEKEKLQRATLIFIQSHIAALEVKIPNYYVAIEAITGHISSELAKGKKSLSPIKDDKLARDLIQKISDLALKAKTDGNLKDEEFDMEILVKNINKLNAPPNADKLSESFTHLGYSLSKEQKDVLINRNRFLHGSFLNIPDDDEVFREALHTALRLQFMIALLIYKLAGFEGKIINYAELWSNMTGKKLGEERLVKI